MVQTHQGEYWRNRLQLNKAAKPTAVPVTASATISTTVQPTSVLLYTKYVIIELLCSIDELPDNNNKGNINVSAECTPDPPSAKVV